MTPLSRSTRSPPLIDTLRRYAPSPRAGRQAGRKKSTSSHKTEPLYRLLYRLRVEARSRPVRQQQRNRGQEQQPQRHPHQGSRYPCHRPRRPLPVVEVLEHQRQRLDRQRRRRQLPGHLYSRRTRGHRRLARAVGLGRRTGLWQRGGGERQGWGAVSSGGGGIRASCPLLSTISRCCRPFSSERMVSGRWYLRRVGRLSQHLPLLLRAHQLQHHLHPLAKHPQQPQLSAESSSRATH